MSPLLLVLGLLIGVSLGALGGGGSILTVPALVYLVGQPPQDATTSSLLIVGAAALVAIVPHARRGNVRLGQGLTFGALGIVGSYVGSAASGLVSSRRTADRVRRAHADRRRPDGKTLPERGNRPNHRRTPPTNP